MYHFLSFQDCHVNSKPEDSDCCSVVSKYHNWSSYMCCVRPSYKLFIYPHHPTLSCIGHFSWKKQQQLLCDTISDHWVGVTHSFTSETKLPPSVVEKIKTSLDLPQHYISLVIVLVTLGHCVQLFVLLSDVKWWVTQYMKNCAGAALKVIKQS